MAENVVAHTAVPGEVGEHHPTALGIAAGGWVAIAMLVVFAIAWFMKVPSIIAGMLDRKIAGIREQLDTASKLRAEAEALKAEYEAKAREADAQAEALRASAARQAEDIIAKAKLDATALIARHEEAAQEKIASAERAALVEVRARVADAATRAAAAIIADRHGADADKAMVDQTIAGLGRLN